MDVNVAHVPTDNKSDITDEQGEILFSEDFETTIDELLSRYNVSVSLGNSCAVDIVDGKLKMEVSDASEGVYLDFMVPFPNRFVFSYRYMIETAVPGEGSVACFILYPNEFVRIITNANTGSTFKYCDGSENAIVETELETKMGVWYTLYTAVDLDAGTYTILREEDGSDESVAIVKDMKLQDVPKTPLLRLMTEWNSAAVAYYDDLEIRTYDPEDALVHDNEGETVIGGEHRGGTMQKFIVSKDPTIFEAWPDVCLCDNDRLICVFSECTDHGNRNMARVTYVISEDRGRTWGKKHYLSEPGTQQAYFNCARISRLSDGTLAVTCDLIKGSENGQNVQVYLWFSYDNGDTWSKPIQTPARGIVPERLTELPSGRWLLAAHTNSPKTGKLCQYLWYSDDKGKTWSDRVTVADDPRYNLCEAGLLVVDDDTVICFMRENSFQGWDGFKAISHDRGETWEGVYHVPLPGCHRPTVGWLSNGYAFVTYRFLQGGNTQSSTYQNVMGALITRESVLETVRDRQSARIFPLSYDRNLHADCGYTGWVQFDDGEILVVNYLMDDAKKAWIEAIVFRPEDILIVN